MNTWRKGDRVRISSSLWAAYDPRIVARTGVIESIDLKTQQAHVLWKWQEEQASYIRRYSVQLNQLAKA